VSEPLDGRVALVTGVFRALGIALASTADCMDGSDGGRVGWAGARPRDAAGEGAAGSQPAVLSWERRDLADSAAPADLVDAVVERGMAGGAT
jgi:hypothetical protein